MVKYLAIVRPLADFDAAHAVSADWVALLDPVDHVEVVDMLFDDVVAADPYEVVPVAHLVLHFRELAAVLLFQLRPRVNPRRGAVPVAAHGSDFTNRSVPQPKIGRASCRERVEIAVGSVDLKENRG